MRNSSKIGVIIVALVCAACSMPYKQIALWKAEAEHSAKVKDVARLTTEYMRRGDYKGALKYAEEWSTLAPKESEAHHAKGTCLAHLNRSTEALDALNEAVRLDPSSGAATERGFVMEKTKIFMEMVDTVIDPALENKPDDADALIRDGERLALAQQFDAAAQRFTAVIKLRPEAGPYYMRGQCYLRMNNCSREAAQDFAMVERINGDKPFRLSPLVDDYKRLAAPDGLDPLVTVDEVQRFHADALLGLKQFDEALVHANKAIKFVTNNPEYYQLRSNIYQKLGQNERARVDTQRAKDLRAELHLGPSPQEDLIQAIKSEGLPNPR